MAKKDSDRTNKLVWIDLEMTGLVLDDDKITEIACLITDTNLNIVAEGPEIIINQPVELIDETDGFLRETFLETDFVERMKASKYTTEMAEKEVLTFIKEHIDEDSSPLCGNTIFMDRMFLIKYMPKIHNYLHYRLIDVSTFKNLAERWYPDMKQFETKEAHRALDDIKESVDELAYYRKHLFKK